MQFKQVSEFIINKLNKELPGHLTYHSIDHTLDVYNAAKNIGEKENITADELIMLLTAALFHDSGFLLTTKGHEEVSCQIAKKTLPDYGYNTYEIEQICGLIMATRLPQTPKSHLEKILADADLDYLGRDDFFDIGNTLYNELSLAGLIDDKFTWNQSQFDFMKNHNYFTNTALNLRQVKKAANMDVIKAELLTQTPIK